LIFFAASEFSSPAKTGDYNSKFSSSVHDELQQKLNVANETISQLKLDLEESYTNKFESELALKNTISRMSVKVPFLLCS